MKRGEIKRIIPNRCARWSLWWLPALCVLSVVNTVYFVLSVFYEFAPGYTICFSFGLTRLLDFVNLELMYTFGAIVYELIFMGALAYLAIYLVALILWYFARRGSLAALIVAVVILIADGIFSAVFLFEPIFFFYVDAAVRVLAVGHLTAGIVIRLRRRPSPPDETQQAGEKAVS